jgi:hypothetical protein
MGLNIGWVRIPFWYSYQNTPMKIRSMRMRIAAMTPPPMPVPEPLLGCGRDLKARERRGRGVGAMAFPLSSTLVIGNAGVGGLEPKFGLRLFEKGNCDQINRHSIHTLRWQNLAQFAGHSFEDSKFGGRLVGSYAI